MSIPGAQPAPAPGPALAPDPALAAELIGVANRYGADPAFSRAGGGNASVKADGVLWIKPSGVPLETLAANDLVPLSQVRLLEVLEAEPSAATSDTALVTAAAAARLGDPGGRRPSVELLFHALLPERYVLHTHPILVNSVTCAAGGEALAARLFGDRVVWVPYTDPGLPLARAIVEARTALEGRTGRPAPAITLLGNHGLIVAGDTAAAIDAETGWLTGIIQATLDASPASWGALERAADPARRAADGVDPSQRAADPSQRAADPSRRAADGVDLARVVAPVLRELLLGPASGVVLVDHDPLASGFTATPEGRAYLAGGPLIPDHIVYAKSFPLVVDLAGVASDAVTDDAVADGVAARIHAALEDYRATHGEDPAIAVVPGVGLLAVGADREQADTARLVTLDMLRVAAGALRLGGVRHLTDRERMFIEGWEAEAYRRLVAADGGAGLTGERSTPS